MTPSHDPGRGSDSKDIHTLSSGMQWALNMGVPAVYPGALLVFWLTPMQFGFGQETIVYLGWVSGISGLLLWILSTVHLGKSLAVLPGSKELVTRGVYRRIRHPVYWGINFTLTGLALCLGSVWGLVYIVVLVFPLNLVRARMEDERLEEQFGEAYLEWRRGTWF